MLISPAGQTMSLEKSRPYDYRMSSAEKEWVRRWKEAGAEMAEIRRRELRVDAGAADRLRELMHRV